MLASILCKSSPLLFSDEVLMKYDYSHLHGHQFQLVQRSTDYTSDDPELNPPINESRVNPMRRDTVQVPSGEGVTLRFVADNPGAWIFHCTF